MLQRSIWSGLFLSAAVASMGFIATTRALGQEQTAETDPVKLADNVLHYSLVNNTGLAKGNADALLAKKQKPEEVLKDFETAALNGGYPDFRSILVQDLRRPDLSDSITKVLDQVDEGFRVVARDPVRIRADIERLSTGPRPYQIAKDRLTAAGQFAVPIYLEYLQNAGKKELHPFIIRIMGEIGRPLLTPLIEELRVADPALRVQLINVIAQIGYPQALPALRNLSMDPSTSGALKLAVDNAINQIDRTGRAGSMSPADLYVAGGENYYNNKSSYAAPLAGEKTNPIWLFDSQLNNVNAIQVPTEIWNCVMAMRMAEAALKLEPGNSAAISLWLAADLKREIMLPTGATDPSKPSASLDAAFYAHASGPSYMNPVLGRALDTGDSALALRAIDALASTGAVTGLVSGEDSPLVRALKNPDREVRFQAAFALAIANPMSQFPSYHQVVPILAQAVSANANPAVVLVVKDDDMRNAVTDALRNSDTHYTVYSGSSLSAALAQAQTAPAIDVVIVPSDIADIVPNVKAIGRTDYRFTGVPVLVAGKAEELPTLKLKYTQDKSVAVVDDHSDAAMINTALTAVRAAMGTAPIAAEAANKDSLKALELLNSLANDHRSIYTIADAIPALVHALKDTRPEVVTAAAVVQGKLNSPECQRALAMSALPDGDPAVRAMLFHNLAESAKHTGNTLDGSQINTLIKVVTADPDPKVRAAAAEALGALNVPSNQASTLILQQAR